MKKFRATFERYNPQLGTSIRERIIEAKTIRSAKKKANDIENGCIYGLMTLINLEEIKNS